MLDFRLQTFLILCETMNYTQAAKRLHLTQPAVTGHIQYLEAAYGCKLFQYAGKTLTLTEKGKLLKGFALSLRANSNKAMEAMRRPENETILLRIGATKTIGNYVIPQRIAGFLNAYPAYNIALHVDNTQTLLKQLEAGLLDFALVEGYFDRSHYASRLFQKESFIGICSGNSFLGDRPLDLEDLLGERLILREKGSGTRDILEQVLLAHNYTVAHFAGVTEMNQFAVIKELVKQGTGITFLYAPIVREELKAGLVKRLRLRDFEVQREFNYVYLKDSFMERQYEDFFRYLES